MATLLELVCKHVKAWPDGAERIEQHHEGWLLEVDTGGIERFLIECERSSDWLSASVTKEQWEHAVLVNTTSVQCDAELPIGMLEPCEAPEIPGQQIGRGLRVIRCDVAAFTEGFELPGRAKVHIQRTEYELLLSSRQAWLQVMQALDETHPDWATSTTQGTLVERAIKAIKNDN